MKKFLIKVVVFFLAIALIDVMSGHLFSYLLAHANGGDNFRNNYICDSVASDVLVFGSSRALHHYNPAVLSDSLGMSVYNCGQDGNGIILNYGRFQMIKYRYTPRIIIYDIMPEYDVMVEDDNHKYLGWLRAYYDKDGVSEIFDRTDPIEKYKMLSQLYRYNSKWIQIISDVIHPMQANGNNGYRPLEGAMDTMKISSRKKVFNDVFEDPLKLYYMERLMDISDGTELVFVVSPSWDGIDSAYYAPIIKMCKERGVLFVDMNHSPKYLHNKSLFKDGAHLNAEGANVFTKDLARIVKKQLSI